MPRLPLVVLTVDAKTAFGCVDGQFSGGRYRTDLPWVCKHLQEGRIGVVPAGVAAVRFLVVLLSQPC